MQYNKIKTVDTLFSRAGKMTGNDLKQHPIRTLDADHVIIHLSDFRCDGSCPV